MIICRATLTGITPYSQSRAIVTAKEDKETHDEFEKRCWRDRLHVNDDGYMIIPPMALKNAVTAGGLFLGRKIKGKGMATYTKHFEAGFMVVDPIITPYKAAEGKITEPGTASDPKIINGEWLFLNADGKRGGGSRVWKCYPRILAWSGVAEFHILDPILHEAIFTEALEATGKFIGIGRFRPQKAGMYGRFRIDSVEWIDDEMAIAAE